MAIKLAALSTVPLASVFVEQYHDKYALQINRFRNGSQLLIN